MFNLFVDCTFKPFSCVIQGAVVVVIAW